ncbi:FG-GAP-like repeat-containing protein [Candidatus Binatia bacterium]|nr:FG-GAP-like repeat-containing protein [Candidatus Binatia bacterium]
MTPTGSEGPGVAARATCGDLAVLFRDADGADDVLDTADDDFHLAAQSPAIDLGVDPRLLGHPVANDVYEADFDGASARPRDGDGDQAAEFDAGAHERPDGVQPSPTPTRTSTSTPGPTPTASAAPTPVPTDAPTATPAPTPEPTATAASTIAPTASPEPTASPAPTAEPTPTSPPEPCLQCAACETGRAGICAVGRTFCDGPFAEPECRTTVEPRTESCGNRVDEDCDGEVDEGGVPEQLPTAPPQTGVFVEPLGTSIKFLQNGGSAIGLASGDFDRDGVVDLAVTEDAGIVDGRRVSIVLGNGDGTFGPPSYLVLPPNVSSNAVLAHDVDRDGLLDLLVPWFELRQVAFYRGNGDGTFAAPVPSDVAIRVTQIQVADLNCDGVLDLASIGEGVNATVAIGHGDGTFAAATPYVFSNNPVDLALADVNGDAAPDLVVGSHEYLPLTGIGVRLNDGAGQFGDLIHTRGTTLPDRFGNIGTAQVFGIQVADFDSDGMADAAVSTQGPVGCFTFYKGNGDGTFSPPDYFEGLPALDPAWSCVGGGNLMRRYTDNVAPDVNADGKPDVLFTYGSDDNRVVIGLGRGDGTFEPSVFAASAGTGAPGSPTFPRADGAGVASAVVADVNGDCMLDVVTTGFQTNASQGRMGVLLARAPGDFHAPRIAPLLRDPSGDNGHQTDRGVTVGDFDNDGNPDFAAGVGRAFFTVPGAGIGIDVFEGDGTGRGKALPITLNNYGGTGAAFLHAADFDQDGFLDLVFQGGDGPFGARQSVSTVFGAGDFTFGDRQSAWSPRLDANQTNIRNLIVADFDNDGDPDVAVIEDDGFATRVISTFSNPRTRAPLQFVAEVSVGSGTGFGGRGLVAADFDGDEILDLVAQDFGTNPQRLRFFKGNGDLTFQPGVSILEWLNQGAATTEDLAAADLDGDGDQDLVLAQYYHGCAYVLLGHDDGTFDAPVCYPVWGDRTNRLAIADFDVDGALDIVVGIENAGLSFVRGHGDGTFENGQPYAVGKQTTEVVNVADFDRDGRPDLLWSFNNGNFGHAIVLSNPTGAVPTPTPAPTATLPPGVTHTPAPTPTPTPTPRATATPPANLASLVVEPADETILAGGSQAYTATGVLLDGTSVDLTGGVAWSSSAPAIASMGGTGTAAGVSAGTTTITAAIGPIAGSTSLSVGARVVGDGTSPVAAITSPAANAEVTQSVDVVGTATDASFLKYELEVAPAGETTFTLLKRGSAPVANGVLGQLDPTVLLNGPSTVRLRVFDAGGNVAEATTTVVVARERKVGLFSIAFTDLDVELAGLPISITRTYDSRDKGKGDFGVGWRLDIQTLRLRTNRILGTGWTTQQSGLNVQLVPLDQHYVALTLPDGKVETFDLQLSPTAQPFSLDFTNAVGFTPRPGTLGTLESLDNTSLLVVPGGAEVELWDDTTFQTYAPRRFRYTSPTGQKIVIDRLGGVESVTDPNGNGLTFDAFGITHTSGKSVAFTRDGEGRITQITDPAGAIQQYAYDARGDLVRHTSPVGNQTKFTYDRAHGLLDVVDPTGTRVARNEYDASGRLVATIDADGKRIEFAHDLGGSQEVVTDRLGKVTVYTYDAVGNVTSKTDPMGGLTTYTHDGRGNQLTETDPEGRTSTKTFDAAGNVLTSTDFDGNTTTKTYNARRQVLTVVDSDGRTTTNVYDASGNLKQTTDPEGGLTTYTHDARGNVLTSTDPIGRVTAYGYDAFGRRTSETAPGGRVTTFALDANGRVLSQTTAGRVTTFSYDGAGRIVSTGDGLGHESVTTYSSIGDGRKIGSLRNPGGETTSYEYDARGNLVKTTYPDGSTVISTYDAEGRETSRENRDGHTTSYEYDALGRQTKVIHPDGTTLLSTYDGVGRVSSRTDERGHTTTYAYAPNRQIVTDPLGNVTVHEFDGQARRTKTTDALGRVTTLTYDSRGNLTATLFHDGTSKTATYDLAGQKTAETDQAGRTTQFTYDLAGNLETVTDAEGNVTTYGYDARGNRTSQTDANGHTTVLEYDVLDRLVKRTRPLGEDETFDHDANGNLTSHTSFAGQTISYGYDADYRKTSETLPGGVVVSYAYTPQGYRTQAGGDSSAYDSRGRLIEETKASGATIAYGYDGAGNRTSITTSHGTTTFTYDALDRLESVVDAAGTTTYGYDDVGNLTSTAYPNGVTTSYEYDDLNRLVRMTNTGPAGLISSYTYTLGPAGNRKQVVESGPATSGRMVFYTYDAVYRLVEEAIDEPGTAADSIIAYSYDAVGNRTAIDRDGIVTIYVYDADDRLLSETTGAATTAYVYDDDGNLISRTVGASTETYEYDARSRLVGASVQGGANPGPLTYTYDADGVRTSATAGGVTTTYLVDKNREHAQVLVETTGATVATYTYGLDLIRQSRTGSGDRFYQYDGQLSTRQLTDASGATTDTYVYDAFGVTLAAAGTSPNAYLYGGEQLDPNVGFYYLRARYYDASVGRFLATDPEVGSVFDPVSLHRYLYANADPVNNADPSGRLTIPQVAIAAVLIGTIAGIATYAYTKSIGAAITVGVSVAVISFLTLYFVGGLAVGGSQTLNVIREGIQLGARSGTVTRTIASSGRLIGCATLLSLDALLRLPLEQLLLAPGVFGNGVTLQAAAAGRENLQRMVRQLERIYSRALCPSYIRGLPF